MPPKKTAKGKGRKSKKESDYSSEDDKPKKRQKKIQQRNETSESSTSSSDLSSISRPQTSKKWNVKFSTWNVNGVRAWVQKKGLDFLKTEDLDIFCLQETKCSNENLPAELNGPIPGYHCYWLSGDKEGYSGVALLSKVEPITVTYGIGIEKHDKEGRVITAEYRKFFLVAAYVPNSGRGLVRLDYRMEWDEDFRKYLLKLDKEKPVVLCGDLNVAHTEIDLANPKTNKRNAGFTQEERDGFTALLSEGFVDCFRYLYPDVTGAYTFWTYMMNARAKNVGWRLDYFVLSERFIPHLSDCVINNDIFGSDHCPVTLYLDM